ncbi:hypothetical protein GCM10010912_00070 [Paenibacillus albidus]|uniref:Sugar isomerase n=1 Tax=Paenibacillus albidus TaxID=2041023 RepID=A0A917BXN4_9BACL|nr:sugar isomerase [Paenibacillus albidus]GGF58867.1 hypothetical protein GCM10010912_00070 [Paenibacillus albidus]
MRIKRSILNLILGIIGQIFTIGFGIFITRLILVNYGSEVNGLLSSIGQIIVYMSLFEAGIGTATLQALYGPISRNEEKSINSILSATSIYYKRTGIYYFCGLLLLSIIYPLMITSKTIELNHYSITFIILFTGLGGALNYYFLGKYRILLSAEGKSYIDILIVTTVNTLSNILKIILLVSGYSIVVVQGAYFLLMIVQLLIFQIYIKKNYTWINLKIEPDYKSISQKSSVLIHQVSYLIFKNTDVIILSIFTNFKVVSVYVMYNMLFGIIDSIVGTVNTSITFALGQSYNESKEKFMLFYDTYEVYFMALVFSMFTVTYILVLPFIKIYTVGIDDINYIDMWLPILFVTQKILINARSSSNNIINIAGHFKNTKYRSIIESLINLVCSLIFVQSLGIYGVLMGTIVAVLYRSIDILIYANKEVLRRSPWITVKRWAINVCIFLSIVVVTSKFDFQATSYIEIIVIAIKLLLSTFSLFFVIVSIFNARCFFYVVDYFRSKLT